MAELSKQCLQRLEHEQTLFEQDYLQHYLEGETKPKHIGEPYLLHHPDSRHGVLLIHGLMAAPEEVREWADFLYESGYTVYAPRMSGHGTSAVDLSQRKVNDWIASIDRGHEILKCCCEHIVVAGFSTGAAIALHQVINKPESFDALISISAPLKFKKFSSHFAGAVNHWNTLLTSFTRVINTERWRLEFVTNHADNPHINYLRCPVNGIVQIKRLMKEVYSGLPGIATPSLVIHASSDPKVDVQSARDIFEQINSPQKYYREIDFHRHGIVRGDIGSDVFGEVAHFLQKVLTGNTV